MMVARDRGREVKTCEEGKKESQGWLLWDLSPNLRYSREYHGHSLVIYRNALLTFMVAEMLH